MSYKLEYLPVAQRDMIEIVRYISEELKNPIAADRLAVELVGAAESVLTFPYALPVYQPIRSLKHEYRKILVRNFLIFYWVDEEDGQGECTVNLDEDDLARLLGSPQNGCPYFQMDDEYKIVRKQM